MAKAAWDRQSEKAVVSMQNELLREQIRDSIAPFSPLWRRRFAELNRKPSMVKTIEDLAAIPAMGERDVSPSGDPIGMSALVLQAGEAGYTLHGKGPEIRKAMRVRATNKDAYRRIVDSDTRATSYVFTGHGFRYPIASTRNDLDVIARAGARLWSVLGLTSNDVLLSALPPGATTDHVALQYAATAAGAPALFPGADAASLQDAIRLAPPTVLAVATSTAPQILSELADLGSLRTLLLVGAPTDAERIAAAHGLSRCGAPSNTVILGVHAPVGARVLWGECRQSAGATGYHTYPDLEIIQVVDPDSGEATPGMGELVLTQLEMRGSALLRWRTGDTVSAIAMAPCPSCGRSVPRATGLRRAAMFANLESGKSLDLRSIAGVMSSRPAVRDWRLVVGRRGRDGAMSTVIHYDAINPDDPATAIAVATDIRHVTGTLPTQLVAATRDELATLSGTPVSARILVG